MPFHPSSSLTNPSPHQQYASYPAPTKRPVFRQSLARAVLQTLSALTGHDFSKSIDACGGNMWFWSVRATEENRGFECLKSATATLSADDLPDWRRPDPFAELAASFPAVEMDAEHRRIFDEYRRTSYALVHKPEHGCWQMHSRGLADVHESLGLRGNFPTLSPGTDPQKPNCYVFLRRNGGMFVVWFGGEEHPLCGVTSTGHPCATLNELPDLETACRSNGGIPAGKGWYFDTFAKAEAACRALGLVLPPTGDERPTTLKPHANGVLAEVERSGRETIAGWAAVGRTLQRLLPLETDDEPDNYDHFVRQLVTSELQDAGFMLRIETGQWVRYSKGTIVDALIARGVAKPAVSVVMGSQAFRPWFEVNEPFQPEFLPNRQWNLHGAKLRFAPKTCGPLSHENWDRIFDHLGIGLDDAVKAEKWCQKHGIATGAQYLKLWAARLIREPKRPLPYLFLYREGQDGQNAGKSSLHRALGLLFDRGYTDAGLALNEQFNRQLAGAILCYIDERQLSERTYLLLKELVEAPTMMIRQMRTDAYCLPNLTHWIHTSNDRRSCPIFEGDQRIVMVEVPPLLKKDELNWHDELRPALEREAPDFLASLYAMEMPDAATRLYLPIPTTEAKQKAMALTKSNCLDQAALLDALTMLGPFKGTIEVLQKQIGKGAWPEHASHFAQALKKLQEPMLACNLRLIPPASGREYRIEYATSL